LDVFERSISLQSASFCVHLAGHGGPATFLLFTGPVALDGLDSCFALLPWAPDQVLVQIKILAQFTTEIAAALDGDRGLILARSGALSNETNLDDTGSCFGPPCILRSALVFCRYGQFLEQSGSFQHGRGNIFQFHVEKLQIVLDSALSCLDHKGFRMALVKVGEPLCFVLRFRFFRGGSFELNCLGFDDKLANVVHTQGSLTLFLSEGGWSTQELACFVQIERAIFSGSIPYRSSVREMRLDMDGVGGIGLLEADCFRWSNGRQC